MLSTQITARVVRMILGNNVELQTPQTLTRARCAVCAEEVRDGPQTQRLGTVQRQNATMTIRCC